MCSMKDMTHTEEPERPHRLNLYLRPDMWRRLRSHIERKLARRKPQELVSYASEIHVALDKHLKKERDC